MRPLHIVMFVAAASTAIVEARVYVSAFKTKTAESRNAVQEILTGLNETERWLKSLGKEFGKEVEQQFGDSLLANFKEALGRLESVGAAFMDATRRARQEATKPKAHFLEPASEPVSVVSHAAELKDISAPALLLPTVPLPSKPKVGFCDGVSNLLSELSSTIDLAMLDADDMDPDDQYELLADLEDAVEESPAWGKLYNCVDGILGGSGSPKRKLLATAGIASVLQAYAEA